MPLSVDYGPSLIHMSVSIFSHFCHLHQNHIHNGNHGAILKVFNCYLLPNRKSVGAETQWKASGQHAPSTEVKIESRMAFQSLAV